jgi:hypothetical protein
MLRSLGFMALASVFALPFTAHAEDARTPELYADFSHGAARGTLEITEHATDANPYYGGSHRLLSNDNSSIKATFDLDEAPEHATLRLEHLTASQGSREGYSPINIYVNEQVAVENFSPQAMNYVWNEFDIGQYLQQGENEVVIRLGNARTHYWIKRMEIDLGH